MSSCGCGSSCKCSGGCGGCKKNTDLTEKSTTPETVILEVAPPKGHSEGSDTATGCQSEACNCGPNCSCNPCKC